MKTPSLNKYLRLKVTLSNSLKDIYAKKLDGDLNSFYFVVRKFIYFVIVRVFSILFTFLSFDMLTSCSLNGEDPVVRSKRRRRETIYFTYIQHLDTYCYNCPSIKLETKAAGFRPSPSIRKSLSF